MTIEKQSYTIRRMSWSSLPPITVEIECAATTLEGVKLGLAVSVAVGRKESLIGASLSGANLNMANLNGASLNMASLNGASLYGETIIRCFARVPRDDGYTLLAMQLEAGGVKIAAGCRWFTVAEFRAHVASSYPGEPKAVETLWILSSIEQRAADLGIALEPAATIEEPA